MAEFLAWCDQQQVPSVAAVQPLHVAAWIEQQTREHAAPTAKLRLAALRHLFDWLVTGEFARATGWTKRTLYREPRYAPAELITGLPRWPLREDMRAAMRRNNRLRLERRAAVRYIRRAQTSRLPE